jgi:hypothetical protein
LHRKLHITAAQETQWNDLAQVMRDNAKTMVALQTQRTADAQSMNALDVVKSYASVIEAHEAGMKKFIPAFEALYNGMSDAQKKTTDSLFRGRARAPRRKDKAKRTSETKVAPTMESHHGNIVQALKGIALSNRQDRDDDRVCLRDLECCGRAGARRRASTWQ